MSEKKNSFSDWLQQEEAAMSIEIDSANDFIKVTHNAPAFMQLGNRMPSAGLAVTFFRYGQITTVE